MTIRIALIGSRKLEQDPKYKDDIKTCYSIAYSLAKLGVTFTSGLAAQGMDGLAQKAYAKALSEGLTVREAFEVYVGEERDIHRSTLPQKGLARVMNYEILDQLEAIASQVHPAWHRCSAWAKNAHMRNCHQILGYWLNRPVDAVITWVLTDHYGEPTGGTRTAIKIAEIYDIPVFNLAVNKKQTIKDIHQFLIEKSVV